MTENLHLVFSKPPEAISDEEYNRWYDFHLGEILVVPGFTSARRYRRQTVKGDWTPSGHRYLSAYEIEGDPRDVMNELDKEVRPAGCKLPGWFPQITFASFNCHSHGNPARHAWPITCTWCSAPRPRACPTTSSSPGTASTPMRTRRYPGSWPTGGSASSRR
jgi:hypothetical protein